MTKARKTAQLPGFRDFPPDELALRSHIFDAWRRVSQRYGFLEYDGPPLESLELYTQKSGEEIVRQLYEFVDKGDRHVALRPEMTPSLARILGERSRSLAKPIRWFSLPQLFRYERQQRGRLREHFQWNVDLLGEEGVEADAEVLAVALDALDELGLGSGEVRARVSDRVLLSELLKAIGVPEERLEIAFSVVDKMEREPRDRISERLRDPAEVGLSEEAAGRILALFDNPSLEEVARSFADSDLVQERIVDIQAYMGVLDDLGFSSQVEFDLTIVRGLAYYTGIVFEIFDRERELRAICGGGRYDRLLELVGGEALPAVGFGMGDVVLSELLRESGKAPEYHRKVDFYIVSIGAEQAPMARRVARALRGRGHSVVYPLRPVSVRKQFAAAASEGARETIVLGPDEVERGMAVIRDMVSGGEREVSLSDLQEKGSLAGAGPGTEGE